MTSKTTETRAPEMGARCALVGLSVFALSAFTSVLYSIFYSLGDAFPGGGVPVPVFAVVSLTGAAVLGLLSVGVGMAMDVFSPPIETHAPSVDEEEPEIRKAA